MATTKPNNPTAGSAEPYWFEWKLGLLQLVELLDEDSKISSVALQLHGIKGWDDVGVQFCDGRTRLLQAKHSRAGDRITFGDLVSAGPEGGPSLLSSLGEAWKHEMATRTQIECVLVTNRGGGINWHGDRPPLEEFLPKLKVRVASAVSLTEIRWDDEDPRYLKAWELFTAELKSLSDSEKISFLKTLSIEVGFPDLPELEEAIRSRLAALTGLPDSSVNSIFNALVASLRKWTCHSQREHEWITGEALRSALSDDEDHPSWLGHCEVETPEPFFPSRSSAVDAIRASLLSASAHRVDFLAAEPGAGKTSCISKLSRSSAVLWKDQCVSVRFYAYRPIRPGEPDVGNDSGVGVLPETLWLGLLWQIRDHLRKTRLLAELRVPVWLDGLHWEAARVHVLRISDALGAKWGRPFVICVDGIDHAARAKRKNLREFLQTLPSPDDIPTHVRLLLAGQPADAYEEYPFFLRHNHSAVRNHYLGTLTDEDLQMLWRASKPSLASQSESGLIRLLVEKAQRRTLPTVYAVEDIREANTLEEAGRILGARPLGDSLHKYYDAIWKSASSSAPDEPRLAALFVLLRERPTSALLSSAFPEAERTALEWSDILRKLRPLVRETDQGFEILHNDLRVHLEARLATEPFVRRDVASALANHYRKPTSDRLAAHLSLLNLLTTAERGGEFADDFTTTWVIEAGSLDLTGEALAIECSSAFAAATDRKDWRTLHSVACASLTVNRVHECIKNSGHTPEREIKSAPTFLAVEGAPLPLELWDGSEFSEIIEGSENLIDCGEVARARQLLIQWVGGTSMSKLVERLAEIDEEEEAGRRHRSTQTSDLERFGRVCALCRLPLTFIKMTPKAVSSYHSSIEVGWARGLAQLPNRWAALRVWSRSYPIYLAPWVSAIFAAADHRRWGEVRALLTRLAKSAGEISPNDRLVLGWHAARSGANEEDIWQKPLLLPNFGLPGEGVKLQTLVVAARWISYTQPLREPTQIAEDLASLLDGRRFNANHKGVGLTLTASAVLGRILRRLDKPLPKEAPLTVLPQTIEDLLRALWCKYLPVRDMPHDEFQTPSKVAALLARSAWDCNGPYNDIVLRIGKERFEEAMLWPDGKDIFDILWEGGEKLFLKQTVRAKANHVAATLHEEDPNSRADYVARLLHFTRRLNLDEETRELKKRLQLTRAGYISSNEWVFEPLIRWFASVRKHAPSAWKVEGAQLLALETICEQQRGDNNHSDDLLRELGASALQCGPKDVGDLFMSITTGKNHQPVWSASQAVTGGLQLCLKETHELGEECVLCLAALSTALAAWPRGSPISTLAKILSAKGVPPDTESRPEWKKALAIAVDIQGAPPSIEHEEENGDEEKRQTQDERTAEQVLQDILNPSESSWSRIRDIAALAEKARTEQHPKRDALVAVALAALQSSQALSRYVELRDTDLMLRLRCSLKEEELWQVLKALTAIVDKPRKDLGDPLWAFTVAFIASDLACWAKAVEEKPEFSFLMLRQLLEMHWKWHGVSPSASAIATETGEKSTWAETAQLALLFLTQTDACETLYMVMCGIRFFAEAFPSRIPHLCREGLKSDSAKDAILALSQLWATRYPSALAPALADLSAAQSNGILDDRLEAWAACALHAVATGASPQPFHLPKETTGPEILFPGDGQLFEAESHMQGLLRINSFATMANTRLDRAGIMLGPMEKAFRHMARAVKRGEFEFPTFQLPSPKRLASSNSSPRQRHNATRMVGDAILYQCQGQAWSPRLAAAVRLCMGLGMDSWIASAPPNVWPDKKAWPDDFEVERWIEAGASPAHDVSQQISALLEGHDLHPSLILLGAVLHVPTYRRDIEFCFWLSKPSETRKTRKTGSPAGRTLAGWLSAWSFATSEDCAATSVHFVGTLVNYPHASLDLTPTNEWTENWHWKIDPSNSLRFNSKAGAKAAWFERWITSVGSPHRGAWRQGILSRWVARRDALPREADELRGWRRERTVEAGLLTSPE